MIKKNKWKKIGKILSPNNKFDWSQNYMSLPTQLPYENLVRIYLQDR